MIKKCLFLNKIYFCNNLIFFFVIVLVNELKLFKIFKNFATRHWRPEVTINMTTVSKHFYEIKILPIIRTCA
jgi:hypothetical protein